MAFQHCRTKSEIEEYLRALRDPKTPADWVIVLSDPRSLQYQLMMNLINENVELEFFTIQLLDRWAEIDEEVKQQRIAEIREQEENSRLIDGHRLQVPQIPKPANLNNKSVAELENLLASCIKEQEKIDAVEKNLLQEKEQIQVDIKKHSDEWNTWQDKCSAVFTETLKNLNVSEDVLKEVNFKHESVLGLAEKISAIKDLIVEASDVGRKEIANTMEGKKNVLDEIRFYSVLNQKGEVAGMLMVIKSGKNKQELMDCMSATKNPAIYQEGVELVARKNKNEDALREARLQRAIFDSKINHISKFIEQNKYRQPTK